MAWDIMSEDPESTIQQGKETPHYINMDSELEPTN